MVVQQEEVQSQVGVFVAESVHEMEEPQGLDAEHVQNVGQRWSRLKKRKDWDQEKAVDALLGDDRSWALAEKICLASESSAANRADEALRLARLAVRLAEHIPDEGFRLHLLGWVEPFLANALRVGGNLASSAQTLAHADEMWAAGAPLGVLDDARRLDLKASLFMYYGRFEEVRSLLNVALKSAKTEHARARLLIKWAGNLEFAGEHEAALEVLRAFLGTSCRGDPASASGRSTDTSRGRSCRPRSR